MPVSPSSRIWLGRFTNSLGSAQGNRSSVAPRLPEDMYESYICWVSSARPAYTPAVPGGRPNVLLVMADQLAAWTLPAYGNHTAVAPQLAQLGAEGVVFDAAYCSSPLCTPSRSSLL